MNDKVVQDKKQEVPQQQEKKEVKQEVVLPLFNVNDALSWAWEAFRRKPSIHSFLVLADGNWTLLSSRMLTKQDLEEIPETELSIDNKNNLIPSKKKSEDHPNDRNYMG